MTTDAQFDSWAIVEVMGFKKLAGHVTEQQIAGASLLRVDVPECVTGEVTVPAYSKLIGVGSIYMITPTDEATARKAANVLAHQNDPLPIYIPPEQKRLPHSDRQVDPDHEDFDGLDGDDYDPDDPNDLFGQTGEGNQAADDEISVVESGPSIVGTGAKSDA